MGPFTNPLSCKDLDAELSSKAQSILQKKEQILLKVKAIWGQVEEEAEARLAATRKSYEVAKMELIETNHATLVRQVRKIKESVFENTRNAAADLGWELKPSPSFRSS